MISTSIKLPMTHVSSQVGTYNSTGQHYHGHYSIWLTNELQEKLAFLQDILLNPPLITNWVNGNLYQRSSEVSGVLPIPADIRLKLGMSEYNSAIDSKQLHHFLAAVQGTRKPVLPIHTREEKLLFTELMRTNPAFNSSTSSPNWSEGVKIWNRYADSEVGISYKVGTKQVLFIVMRS